MPGKRRNAASKAAGKTTAPLSARGYSIAGGGRGQLGPFVLLAILAVLVVVCFYPVTKYFFVQDDFVLLQRAAYEGSSYFQNFFERVPGQFRPLSKGFYFAATYRLFGFNPYPYHLLSLLLHVINTILFYRLMLKLKVTPAPAMICAALFSLSVTVLNVVGWIACVQQLLGECFMLLSLLFGYKALQKRARLDTVISIAAYVLALMSMEQTYPAPLMLFLIAFSGSSLPSTRGKIFEAARKTAPLLSILALYLLFMLFWKGLPEGGDYAFVAGANVLANLATYLDRSLQFSVVYPFTANVPRAGFTVAHLFLLVLTVYNVARGRGKQVLWATAFFMLTILPTLFLENHSYYIHLYIPSLGILYLIALALDDFWNLLSGWSESAAKHGVLVVFLLVSIMSFTTVRTNETTFVRSDFELPNNFVFRKAMIAKNAIDNTGKKTSWTPNNGKLYMISKSDISGWYSANVIVALGRGDAFKLFYDDPGLEVVFMNRGETITGYNPNNSLILIYDDMGHVFTTEEAERQTGQPAVQRK